MKIYENYLYKNPNSLNINLEYAFLLADNQNYKKAIEHFKICTNIKNDFMYQVYKYKYKNRFIIILDILIN